MVTCGATNTEASVEGDKPRRARRSATAIDVAAWRLMTAVLLVARSVV